MNIKKIVMNETIPDKPFFKSTELVSLLKVKPHEVSYWETQFPKVRAHKNKHGQKIYQRDDVLMLAAIKHLLHEKKFTIAGTKKVLSDSDDFLSLTTKNIPTNSHVEMGEKLSVDLVNELQMEPCISARVQADDVLAAASDSLAQEETDFNTMTADIYVHNGEDLKSISNVQEEAFQEEILVKAPEVPVKSIPLRLEGVFLKQEDFERNISLLKASKKNLKELLLSLDSYRLSPLG